MPTIDQYSLATVPLEMHFGATSLGMGTAFICEKESQFYLITN